MFKFTKKYLFKKNKLKKLKKYLDGLLFILNLLILHKAVKNTFLLENKQRIRNYCLSLIFFFVCDIFLMFIENTFKEQLII